MLRSVIETSMRFRYLAIVFAAALLVVGVMQMRNEPVDLLPEFSPPQVEVQTESLGLAAAEVEALITVPLEEMLAGLPWTQTTGSTSITGLSSITVTFEPGTDIMDARQMVQERLLQTSALPKVAKRPAMLQPVSTTNRVLRVGLSSPTLSLIDISVLARWKIKPRLLGVPGVANVAIWGQRERQLQVQVDPARLKEMNVRLIDVIRASGDALWSSPLSFLQASTPGTGGFIDMPNQRMDVRHLLPISSPEDLARIAFRAGDGSIVRLGDVAEVVEDHQPMIGDAVVGDRPGVLLVVEKFPGANTVEVTRRVEEALAALAPGLPGVEINTTTFRPASFIDLATDNLAKTALASALLVAIALFGLLRDWRAAVVALVVLPVSLMAAVVVLLWFGAALNAMTLAGLALAVGVVLDDAIVGADAVAARLRQDGGAAGERSTAQTVLAACLETRRPLGYATLIILLLLAPVLVMGGIEGSLFGPMARAAAMALLCSLVVALTIAPALSLVLWSGVPPRPEPPLQRWLRNHYEGPLAKAIEARPMVLGAAGVALLVGVALLPVLRPSLPPSFQEREFVLRWTAESGISHTEMSRLVGEVSEKLRVIPGVRDVGAQIGRAVMSDQVADINTAEIWVSLDRRAGYDKTVAAVREVAADYPGLSSDVLSFADQRIAETLAAEGDPIVVRLFGPDLEMLRGKADEVQQAISRIHGVVSPRVASTTEEPQIEIEVDLEAAERYGIKPGDVRREATTLLAGLEVGNLFEEQKVFEVIVVGALSVRDDIESIRELQIGTPDGAWIRLGDVADVRLAKTRNTFERTGASRSIDITAGVQGRDLDAVVEEVERNLAAVEFPLEYHAELLEDYADRDEWRTRLLVYALVAALGIFLLLQAALRSWRLAALTFIAMFSALVGAVLAAFATGAALSLGVAAGLVAVLGLTVRSSMLLLQRYQELEARSGERHSRALAIGGAMERVGPLVASAVATALAMLPFVMGGTIPGLEVAHPMAVVVLGGLVTSTLFALFVVPTLYAAFGTEPELELDEGIRHAPS